MNNKTYKFEIFQEGGYRKSNLDTIIYNNNDFDYEKLIEDYIRKYNLVDRCDIMVIKLNKDNIPMSMRRYKSYTYEHCFIDICYKNSLEYYYYTYPHLVENYLVHIIKDKKIYVRYFNNIKKAYKYMKNEYYGFYNNNRLVFSEIDDKYVFKQKNKEKIMTLFNDGILSNNLTLKVSDKIDENYFDIKLIRNNKIWTSCIICGCCKTNPHHSNIKIIFNNPKLDYLDKQYYFDWRCTYEFKENKIYTDNYYYCKDHYPEIK
jgi:hypothetical protein